MVDGDIDNASAQIDDGIELVFGLFVGMAELEDTGRCTVAIQQIATGCGGDLVAFGTQQGNILHHHLTADTGGRAQRTARQRSIRLAQQAEDLFAALGAGHVAFHRNSSVSWVSFSENIVKQKGHLRQEGGRCKTPAA